MSSDHKNADQLFCYDKKRAYIAWCAVVFFYFYQYVLRVMPGVMIDDIRPAFQAKAEEFATLGSLYFFCYAIMQIPLGVLVDKFSIKKVACISILFCIGGAFLSSIAPNLLVMQLARVLIGIGSSSAFMISLKIVSDNFAPGKRGFLIGATLTFGTVGAVLSSVLIVTLSKYYTWRAIFDYVGIVGIIIFVVMIIAMPKESKNSFANGENGTNFSLWSVLVEILDILRNGNIVLYTIFAVGLYTPLLSLADLWGVAFVQAKTMITQPEAVHVNMFLYIGLAVGSLLMPWVFEKNNSLNVGIKWSLMITLLIFAYVLYNSHLSVLHLIVSFFLIGVVCGSEMMCFTSALKYASKTNSGMIIGVVNTLNTLGGAFLQQGIGYLLDLHWRGDIDESGLRVYSIDDFIVALSMIVGLLVVCCILSLLLKRAD